MPALQDGSFLTDVQKNKHRAFCLNFLSIRNANQLRNRDI